MLQVQVGYSDPSSQQEQAHQGRATGVRGIDQKSLPLVLIVAEPAG